APASAPLIPEDHGPLRAVAIVVVVIPAVSQDSMIHVPAIARNRASRIIVEAAGVPGHADRTVLGNAVLHVLDAGEPPLLGRRAVTPVADLKDFHAGDRPGTLRPCCVGTVLAREREAVVLDVIDDLGFIATVAAALEGIGIIEPVLAR